MGREFKVSAELWYFSSVCVCVCVFINTNHKSEKYISHPGTGIGSPCRLEPIPRVAQDQETGITQEGNTVGRGREGERERGGERGGERERERERGREQP